MRFERKLATRYTTCVVCVLRDIEAQKRLTLEGNIVISVGLFGHSGDDEVWTEGTKAMLVRGNVVFYGRGVQNDVSHPRKHGILRMM